MAPGLVAGSAAAICAAFLSLPLRSPSDTLLKQCFRRRGCPDGGGAGGVDMAGLEEGRRLADPIPGGLVGDIPSPGPGDSPVRTHPARPFCCLCGAPGYHRLRRNGHPDHRPAPLPSQHAVVVSRGSHRDCNGVGLRAGQPGRPGKRPAGASAARLQTVARRKLSARRKRTISRRLYRKAVG